MIWSSLQGPQRRPDGAFQRPPATLTECRRIRGLCSIGGKILTLSTSTFTLVHVVLSLPGIFGDLYVSRVARVCRHDSQGALRAVDLEQEPRTVGGAAFEVDRCDRAALEDAAYEHLVGGAHLDRLARLDDLNSLALIRHDAGQLFELLKAVAQRVN